MRIDRRQLLELRPAPGAELQVREGCLWLTEPGDPRDHVLGPGDRFQLSGRAPVVLSGLRGCEFALLPGNPASLDAAPGGHLLAHRT